MIIKSFNDYNIEIREDGYFNLTSMFKTFGKHPKDYLKTDNAKAFLAALESDGNLILSGRDLVQVIKGGAGEQGTWAHRLVAIDAARWLDSRFHVTIIKWSDELMTRGTLSLESSLYTDEASYVNKLVDIFSRTNKPLRKEVIVINTEGEQPPTRRFDMKQVDSNIYYEVKMHPIAMPDLKEIFFKRRYPDILNKLHQEYKLILVSPIGITEEAECFVRAMKNVHFILGEDLAMEAANLMMRETPFGKEQIQRHILPIYHDILPPQWKAALGFESPPVQGDELQSNESPSATEASETLCITPPESLPLAPESYDTEPNAPDLIYTNHLPLGVSFIKRRAHLPNPYRARFIHEGELYELGFYPSPTVAGYVVRQRMLEVKGRYTYR